MMNESVNSVLQEDLINNAKIINELQSLNNKKIVVTGATGLIGSVLCKSVLCANRLYNCNITIYAVVRNMSKAQKIFENVIGRQEFNIVNYDFMGNDSFEIPDNIDYLIHTAAVTTSKLMVEKPVDTLFTAINGTNAILKFARKNKVSSVVYLSSMEVYGSFSDEKYVDENTYGRIDILDVRSSYSEGKRICECLCNAYTAEFGLPVKSARLAQTFGAGVLQEDNRVYAQFARSAMKKENLVLRTDGSSEGNYCYTRDVIRALLLLGYSGKVGEAYNVVNEKSHMTIREMAELVANDVSNGEIKVEFDIPDEAKSLGYAPKVKMHLSSEKLNKLGWKAEVDMKEAYLRMMNDMEA